MKCKKFLSLILAFILVFSCLSCMSYGAKAETKIYKNVIYMIGDGMGPNHLEWTKAETGAELYMDTMPCQGYRITDSLSGTTDSAAGGTALACGLRAFNSNVGTLSVLINGHGFVVANYRNLAEVAQKMGKKTGVVTSDSSTGATPATFTAHTTKRENAEDIFLQQLMCKANLIWSASSGFSKETIVNAGWSYADNISDLKNLSAETRSFAQFEGKVAYKTGEETDAPLSELTSLAIEKLDNDKGFFLMVEGAHIDKYSHANEKENMMASLLEFDEAIKNAVEFAKADGNTLVIVTADHETGAITFNNDIGAYEFTSGDHSNTNVPLRVYGSDGLVENNGDIIKCGVPARFTARAMGFTGLYPAVKINPLMAVDFIKVLVELVKN